MPTNHVGQRQTVQRTAIMDAIEAADGPLTVNQIHLQALATTPNLGVATVYRTVRLLLDSGDIHAVVLPDGQLRYEAANLGHHHHFRCNVCHLVYDLPGCMMPIPNGTSLPNGFRVEGHEITLYGTCPKCEGKD